MYKETLQTIQQVELYAILSFILFFLFFILITIHTFRMDKSQISRYSQLPLDQQNGTGTQSSTETLPK